MNNINDPFADCVLTKMVRDGKVERYSYADDGGLPELRTESGLGWSPFFEKVEKNNAKSKSV